MAKPSWFHENLLKTVWNIEKLNLTVISSNQLFSNFFCKNVDLTKIQYGKIREINSLSTSFIAKTLIWRKSGWFAVKMVISTSFRNCGNLISYISLVFGKVTFLLKKLLKLSKTATHMYEDTNNKILGCRDPRCKHEYLDSPWFDRNITGGWGWWWKWQTYISTRS